MHWYGASARVHANRITTDSPQHVLPPDLLISGITARKNNAMMLSMMLAMHMVRILSLLVASLLALCSDSCNDPRVATLNSSSCSRLCADRLQFTLQFTESLRKYLT